MLGVLRKDFTQLKFLLWIPLVATVLFGIIFAVNEETLPAAANLVAYFSIAFAPHAVLHEDRGKTMSFLKALPLHPRTIVSAKFAWFLCLVGVQIGLLSLLQWMTRPAREAFTLLSLSWATFGSLSLGSAVLASTFLFRGERAGLYRASVAGVALAVWIIVQFDLKAPNLRDPATFFNTAAGPVVAAAAGLAVASAAWWWSWAAFERRDLTDLD